MFESLKNLLKHFTGNQESASATPGASTQQETTIPSATAEESNTQYITLNQFNLGIVPRGPATGLIRDRIRPDNDLQTRVRRSG